MSPLMNEIFGAGWKINPHFCVVWFPLFDARVREILKGLRILFSQPSFRTKAGRMGKVFRITEDEMRYYTFADNQVKKVE